MEIVYTGNASAAMGVVTRALKVHMTTVGSYERPVDTGVRDQEVDVSIIRQHLANWYEPTSEFDEACRSVLVAALHEADKLTEAA